MKDGRISVAIPGVVLLLVLASACENESGSGPSTEPTVSGNSAASVEIEYEMLPSILIEAESGRVTPPMRILDDPDASGGNFVLAPEGPDHKEINKGGDVTYRMDVKDAGRYVLWMRAKWSGACGNSIGVTLDDADLGVVEDAVYDSWHWVQLRGAPARVEAGKHLLIITSREDGSAADQILLTQDRDYRPTGIEMPDVKGRIIISAPPRGEAPASQPDDQN